MYVRLNLCHIGVRGGVFLISALQTLMFPFQGFESAFLKKSVQRALISNTRMEHHSLEIQSNSTDIRHELKKKKKKDLWREVNENLLSSSLVAQTVKNLPAMQETWLWSLDQEDPLEKWNGNPLQYSCLENFNGQRSLAGYSSRGHKELDMTD